MIAKGKFEIDLQPQEDQSFAAGRMTIDKVYQGDLQGLSKGQMLSLRTAVAGSAGYVAIEHFEGTLENKKGGLALQHSGSMQAGESQLTVTIIPDSGTEQLTGISGSLDIDIKDGKHFYTLSYQFAADK